MAKQLGFSKKTATMPRKGDFMQMRSADGEGEEGGDAGEFDAGIKLQFLDIPVNEKFVNAVCDHPNAWGFLFNIVPGKQIEPASQRVRKLKVDEKFNGGSASIEWGIANSIDLTNTRVGGIVITADNGGAKMRCWVQGIPPEDANVVALLKHGGGQVKLSMKFGEAGADDEQASAGQQKDFVNDENDAASAETPATNGVPAMGRVTGATH